jgi:glucose dehydrogenase
MSTSTRLRITLIFGLFLAAVTLYAIARSMETVAATSIAGIMTILSTYLWSQTKRPHYEVTYQESDDPVVHSRNRSNDYDVQMDG